MSIKVHQNYHYYHHESLVHCQFQVRVQLEPQLVRVGLEPQLQYVHAQELLLTQALGLQINENN